VLFKCNRDVPMQSASLFSAGQLPVYTYTSISGLIVKFLAYLINPSRAIVPYQPSHPRLHLLDINLRPHPWETSGTGFLDWPRRWPLTSNRPSRDPASDAI